MKKSFDFLPRGYRSLLDYISPTAFEVIDWKAALKRSTIVSKELIFGSSLGRLKDELYPLLPQSVSFDDEVYLKSNNANAYAHAPQNYRNTGQKILEIYFTQLYKCKNVLLDLRQERFSVTSEELILWKPTSLWYSFSNDFLCGIRNLYLGFYLEQDSTLQEGLHALGLASREMNPESKAKLLELLLHHFGQGRSAPMKFEIKHFMQSFDSLFVFLKESKIRLSEDFLFLGVYIVTLYLHLEKIGEAFDVLASFKKVALPSSKPNEELEKTASQRCGVCDS